MGSLHARVLASSPTVELVWIADPQRAAGELVAQRYGTAWRAEPDLDTVEAVVIASPTHAHHAMALQVIDAGLALLVEKPLADTLAHAEEIVAMSAARDTVLMCGLLERFNPAVRTAVEISRAPLHVETVRHSPYAERIRTGVAADLLIHDIDVVARLFGETPVQVFGHFGFFEPRSEAGREDMAEASLRFARGQLASLSASRVAQRKVRSLTITELDRSIEVDMLRQAITIYKHVQESGFDEDAGYRQQTIIDIPVIRHPGEPLQLQLARFVDLVRGEADSAEERDSLLLPHRLIDQITTAALGEVG
jgi:predicted dehydrogenase